jgi:SAM-dependent methyltransferase
MRLDACPICKSKTIVDFLCRPSVPVHQNLVCCEETRARSISRGRLEMVVCSSCGFAFNRSFDSSLLAYGTSYDNSQNHSPAFEHHLESLVNRLLDQHGVRNCRIVEVGCGKGDFLRRLVKAPGSANRGIGMDPSYEGPASAADGRLEFRRQFFDRNTRDVAADVVICRHVIEHIDQPVDFLRAIRQGLQHSPQARLFFETPCVSWILQNNVTWDFFYEHCSLFTSNSLTAAFERAGFDVIQVNHVFTGQYLWLEAVPAEQPSVNRLAGADVVQQARDFGRSEAQRNLHWSRTAEQLRLRGNVAVWGAGAKGVTLANVIDPDRRLISCIVDINPNKQGNYLAGTGHPIVSPNRLREFNVKTAIVLNPNYGEEVAALTHDLGLNVSVIDLMEWEQKAA